MGNQIEGQYKKFVNISYLCLAALLAYVVFVGAMKLTSIFDLESKVKSIEYVIRIGSLVLGVGLFVGLLKNQKSNAFMTEVAIELLSKVTWPEPKETMVATGVVMITVLIASLMLGVFDWAWSSLIRLVV